MGRILGGIVLANHAIPFFLSPIDLTLMALGAIEDRIMREIAETRLGVGKDGLFVTVRSHGGLPVGSPQLARCENLQIVWEKAQAFIDDESNYEKPVRLLGRGKGPDAIHDGGPGYRPYHRASVSPSGFRVLSTRPYHPIFTTTALMNLANEAGRWIAEGTMPEWAVSDAPHVQYEPEAGEPEAVLPPPSYTGGHH